MDRSSRGTEADFSIEKYGERTAEKEECEEQLPAEYAALLGFYIASVAVLTGAAIEQKRLPKRFSLLDLALLGIAAHKLSRIIAKDRITGILRGIGQLILCPYCMTPWCATALAFGLIFAPRATRFFAGILASVAVSDFLQRAYLKTKQ